MAQVPPSTQEEIENNPGASVRGWPGKCSGGGGGSGSGSGSGGSGGSRGNLLRDAGSQLKQQGSWVASPFWPKALSRVSVEERRCSEKPCNSEPPCEDGTNSDHPRTAHCQSAMSTLQRLKERPQWSESLPVTAQGQQPTGRPG